MAFKAVRNTSSRVYGNVIVVLFFSLGQQIPRRERLDMYAPVRIKAFGFVFLLIGKEGNTGNNRVVLLPKDFFVIVS